MFSPTAVNIIPLLLFCRLSLKLLRRKRNTYKISAPTNVLLNVSSLFKPSPSPEINRDLLFYPLQNPIIVAHQERREAVRRGNGRNRTRHRVGTHRQAVRLQPEDEQVQQGHFPDAVHHSAAEAEPDLDQQKGLSRKLRRGRDSISRNLLWMVRLSRKKTTNSVYIDRNANYVFE